MLELTVSDSIYHICYPLLNRGQDCAKHGTYPAEWDEHWAWRRPS